jgi:hypothetical protein
LRQAASPPARPRLEFWALDQLVPSPRNARTHSAAQVAEIAGSIRAFGFTNPILAGEDGDVIAGHGRLAAARSLGLAEVPVIPLTGLTETQRRQKLSASARAIWQASSGEPQMRGRRPKPTRLKMLTGNPGKSPLHGDEPRPDANIPECPPELGPVARAE